MVAESIALFRLAMVSCKHIRSLRALAPPAALWVAARRAESPEAALAHGRRRNWASGSQNPKPEIILADKY